MSEPALLAIIRGGQTRYYIDDWSGYTLHRELIWGPEALEDWIVARDELEELEETCSSTVVANFDRKQLTFRIDSETLEIPKVGALYNRLVAAAWPGYEIACVALDHELLEALGEETAPDWSANPDYARIEYRPESVSSAVGNIDDDIDNFDDDFDEDFEEDPADDAEGDRRGRRNGSTQDEVESSSDDAEEDDGFDDEDDDDDLEFGETELRAWVTIIGSDGSTEHRQLSELPQELLQAKPSAVEELAELPACEVPAEEVVREGMWVDSGSRKLSIWGGPSTQAALTVVESAWKGWTVQWAPRGYAQHCADTGPIGKVLTTEKALAKLLPLLLSTHRMSFGSMFSVIGGAVKKTAMKATGCLVFVVCLPIFIFGLVSGNWTAVAWTIGITVSLAVIAFKIVEWQVAKKFRQSIGAAEDEQNIQGSPTAGPLDKSQRRAALDALLATAGLPATSKIEPFVTEDDLTI